MPNANQPTNHTTNMIQGNKFADKIQVSTLADAKNYHGEIATFEIGQKVQHVTDQGEITNATITGVSADLLHLSFKDGHEGSEAPETCY